MTQELKSKLGVSDGALFSGGGGGGGGGGAPAAAEPQEEVKEQTEFAVKLVSFDAKTKIKVIKEVRAIAELGLKEVYLLLTTAPDHVFHNDITISL